MNNMEYYQSLPKKRMAAGAILFNASGELLLVNPTYKDSWEVPGGSIELDESPLAACYRELKEELGIDVILSNLLCVDYISSNSEITESIQFLFTGPRLTQEQIDRIVLPQNELSEFRFVQPADINELLGPRLRERVALVLNKLDSLETIYLENGAEPERITN